jgi:hypothetical protein
MFYPIIRQLIPAISPKVGSVMESKLLFKLLITVLKVELMLPKSVTTWLMEVVAVPNRPLIPVTAGILTK